MNVDLLSLDPGSSLAANLPRHNSRPGETGCRHQSSCHTLKGRAPHLPPASKQPRRKGVSNRARRFPGLQRRQPFQSYHIWKYKLSQHCPPGKYSVWSHRLVILKLGKSHSTVFISYRMPESCFWLIWNCLLHLLSPHRQDYLCWGCWGFFMAKDWNPFWWKNVWEYCQPVRKLHTHLHRQRGPTSLHWMKLTKLKILKIYVQKGRQETTSSLYFVLEVNLVLWDLLSIWPYLWF